MTDILKKLIFGNPDATDILIQMVDDHDLSVIEREVESIRKNSEKDFCLIALKRMSFYAAMV